MTEFEPRLRVRYVIRGSYEVDSGDEATARYNAQRQLNIDFTYLDHVVDDSATREVEITEVERVD
jgi:hypothetical protein